MWNNNEIQFARLLCELVASNESLNLKETAESMDLEIKDLDELLDRAHYVFEKAKTEGLIKQPIFQTLQPESTHEYVATNAFKPNERVWVRVKTGDVGIMHNEDGISIDVWAVEQGREWPELSVYVEWSDLGPEPPTPET